MIPKYIELILHFPAYKIRFIIFNSQDLLGFKIEVHKRTSVRSTGSKRGFSEGRSHAKAGRLILHSKFKRLDTKVRLRLPNQVQLVT